MNLRRLFRAPVLLALPFAAIVGACSEDIETGGACPMLCPGQELTILDTVLSPAIEFDTTVVGYPLLGFEPSLLLATRVDTLDVRPIIRFDTIIRGFRPTPDDTVEDVQFVDSATLNIRIRRTHVPLPPTFFIDAFDVDDAVAADSVPAALLAHFVPGRLVGSIQIDSAGFQDSTLIKIPIDTAYLLDVIEDPTRRVRIGLQLRAAGSGQVRVLPVDSGSLGPRLRYRVSPDTAVSVANIAPSSATPTTPLFTAEDFIDYVIVAQAPSPLAAARFAVGGMPGARSYLRFDLPTWLTDSSTILRARLEIVQDPVYGLDDTVKLGVRPQMVVAGHTITDLKRAALLVAPFGSFGSLDSLHVAPADSGLRSLEINAFVRQWRTIDGTRPLPTAIVLRSTGEGTSPLGVRFFGLSAAEELRPRLRVSYVRASDISFGQP